MFPKWSIGLVIVFLFGAINVDGEINLNQNENILFHRIPAPSGFKRCFVEQGSFEKYLRDLVLKPHGALVEFYNGDYKSSDGIYIAVLDQNIGNKNLHQCADAVIRLRADYLWENKLYDKIHFNFTNGFRVDYKKWMAGNRIFVKGNKVNWISKTTFSDSYSSFWKYLETIFTYAGTLSLEQELQPVNIKDLKIGDVFIQGGSPGHAVIVVDKVKNPQSNEILFLLAQSYMPAQQTQILINPRNKNISPWYSSDFGEALVTPEWTFTNKDLYRFKD